MAFKLQFVTVATDTNKQQVLDTITLDASLQEIHDSDADVTEFPVEQGSDITDNIRLKPKMLQVDALITDYSLQGPGSGQSGSNGKRAHASGFQGYAKGTLAALEDYQSKGTLINVTTGLKSYQNMVIKSIRTPRDKKTKNSVRTTIILQSIIIAQSQSVVIKQADPKAQPSQPKGQKTAAAADSGSSAAASIAKGDLVDQATNMGKAFSDSLSALAAKVQGFGF